MIISKKKAIWGNKKGLLELFNQNIGATGGTHTIQLEYVQKQLGIIQKIEVLDTVGNGYS